ncbi:MAG: NosD domain-containing protein [Bacilli bacterium]
MSVTGPTGPTGATGTSPNGFVTVGPSSDGNVYSFYTDGVDDYVEIQQAIDSARDVIIMPGNYNIGNASIVIRSGRSLRGLVIPRYGDGHWFHSAEKAVTAINVSSTTFSPIVMCPGSSLERVLINYPDQTYITPTVYPAAITASAVTESDGTAYCANGLTIRDVNVGSAYIGINFTNLSFISDIIIEGVRGSPLYIGIQLDHCGHVASIFDCQFVPGFGGDANGAGNDGKNYISDHLTAFSIGLDLSGTLTQCKVWGALFGYYIFGDACSLIDCLSDGTQYGIYIDGSHNTVLGGCHYGFHLVDGDPVWEHPLTAITIHGDGNCISGAHICGSEHGVYIIDNSNNNVIFGNDIFGYGLKDDANFCAGVYDYGVNSIVSSNAIMQSSTYTNTWGIFIAGTDGRYSSNQISGTLSQKYCYYSPVREIVDGASTNAGNPNTTGYWYNFPLIGVIVRDTVNSNTYIYINGGWVQI